MEIIKVAVIRETPKEGIEVDLDNVFTGEMKDKETGFTQEQCENLGLPFNPKVEEYNRDNYKYEDATLFFEKSLFSKAEINPDMPLLYLTDGTYYELKDERELEILILKLNNK